MTRGRAADLADRHRIPAAALPDAEPAPRADPRAAARPRLELRLRRRRAGARDLHQLPAQEARRRRSLADPHRARRRLRAPGPADPDVIAARPHPGQPAGAGGRGPAGARGGHLHRAALVPGGAPEPAGALRGPADPRNARPRRPGTARRARRHRGAAGAARGERASGSGAFGPPVSRPGPAARPAGRAAPARAGRGRPAARHLRRAARRLRQGRSDTCSSPSEQRTPAAAQAPGPRPAGQALHRRLGRLLRARSTASTPAATPTPAGSRSPPSRPAKSSRPSATCCWSRRS